MTPSEVGIPASGGAGRAPVGLFLRRNFLPPTALLRLLGAFDRLGAHWKSSAELGLLGRGGTWQVRPSDLAVQAALDVIRDVISVPTLTWARSCGFQFSDTPFLALFPVRMVGDAASPAYQEPHRDSTAGIPHAPICTNVFYAATRAVAGGELAVSARGDPDLSDPVVLQPSVNTIVTLPGDRVHWVQPLYAGERLSVVINVF